MVRVIFAAALIAACAPQTEIYVNADAEVPSSLELPKPLPHGDFVGQLKDPYGQTISIPFEIVTLKGATCYWSRFISLCTGDGVKLTDSAVGPEGLRVRVEPRLSGEYVYYVFGEDSGDADFTVVKGGSVTAFGIVNIASGRVHSRYEARD